MSGPTNGHPNYDRDYPHFAPWLDVGWYFLGNPLTAPFDPNNPSMRYLPSQGQFHFSRHGRPGGTRRATMEEKFPWRGPAHLAARGRTNIGFVDGHVASFAHDELADPRTGRSRYVALWTTLDPIVERAHYGQWIMP
jgi:prepilin-type processing-associated H-X9-DG protein